MANDYTVFCIFCKVFPVTNTQRLLWPSALLLIFTTWWRARAQLKESSTFYGLFSSSLDLLMIVDIIKKKPIHSPHKHSQWPSKHLNDFTLLQFYSPPDCFDQFLFSECSSRNTDKGSGMKASEPKILLYFSFTVEPEPDTERWV